jgi:Ca2+-transporting ATPase
LVTVAGKAGIIKEKADKQFPRIHEIPFTSETKRMTTLHETENMTTAYSKGAVEMILATCATLITEQGERNLTEDYKKEIHNAANSMAENSLRVIAVSYKKNASKNEPETSHTFLGLFGMIDPPRAEAKPAIEKCKQSGNDYWRPPNHCVNNC